MHLSLVDPENLTALSEPAKRSAELSKMETAMEKLLQETIL
jgi:hypothetical protein